MRRVRASQVGFRGCWSTSASGAWSSSRARTRSTMSAFPASDINRASGVNPEHLNYFKFTGHLLGVVVFHHWILNA
ncbi:hypothetical protein BJY52DRAFT_1335557 [Lactarius psammicola]|nr:hypothetical protein BJY52DRAFT_1335557 [Lactarius psammicola]